MLIVICTVLGTYFHWRTHRLFVNTIPFSRAGRFGTKGLAVTFQSSEADQQVMAAIQARFEVAVSELPDHIDPASYSE